MRKVFLCTLAILGVMNICFGQLNINSERITVQKYQASGEVEQFYLKGSEAIEFDIPAFILENDHLERIVINGTLRTALKTTKISFDSKNEEQSGEYICKDVQSKLTPFLGVWGTGSRDHDGVDIQEVIANTSAEKAGITADDNIIEYNGTMITNFPELKRAVLASEIGDRVEVMMENGSNQFAEQVTVGSRGTYTVTYKYCSEEPNTIISNNVPDIKAYTFNAYPNPTSTQSTVSFESGSDEEVIFSVTNLTGKLLHKEVFSNFKGRLSLDYEFTNEREGMYIFSIQQGQELYKRKVNFVK